jgi:thiol:disulfide interchange protein DsbA
MMEARKVVNIALPLAGLAVIVFYNFCGSTCTFLKGGFFGVDLKYLGLAYPVLLLLLVLLEQDLLYIAMISLGVGMEINLVAFQVENGTYCPYCLIFAAILVFLFLFNFRRSKLPLMGIGVALGFLLCFFFFKGAATPVYADEVLVPTFGKGRVQVRLYTDYFCGPCSRMEPNITPLLKDLVRRNVITLTFVDTPVHALTPLYARYFLYIFNQDRSFDQVLRSRTLLFGAAGDKIGEKERLEDYLRLHEVKFKECDSRPTFAALSALISEDKIRSTPTCVIINDGRKTAFNGEAEITKALDLIK